MTTGHPTPTPDTPINDKNLYLSFQLMKRKEYEAAESLLKEGLKEARVKSDSNLEGLYYSALGVLYKLKDDYKKSYKFYQQAEHCLRDDHSIKIITALLLLDEFKQYDTVARKMERVLKDSKDPAILHHAQSILATAYYLMNKPESAKQSFAKLLASNFAELRFAANINFKAVELFVKKGFCLDLCRDYLQKSLDLAKRKKEKVYEGVIQNLLKMI